MTRFLLIRHATTDAVGRRLSGRTTGVHLNEEGQKQAQGLAEQLVSLQITHIYSSPLERAVETAQAISATCQLTTIMNKDFLELDFGDWTNRSFEELRYEAEFHRFNSFRSSTRVPGGETMLEAQARMVNGLQKLCIQHPGETIAVVSHSDLIKATVAYYAGIHLDMFQRIEISPASVSTIEIFEDTARILLLNYTGKME